MYLLYLFSCLLIFKGFFLHLRHFISLFTSPNFCFQLQDFIFGQQSILLLEGSLANPILNVLINWRSLFFIHPSVSALFRNHALVKGSDLFLTICGTFPLEFVTLLCQLAIVDRAAYIFASIHGHVVEVETFASRICMPLRTILQTLNIEGLRVLLSFQISRILESLLEKSVLHEGRLIMIRLVLSPKFFCHLYGKF